MAVSIFLPSKILGLFLIVRLLMSITARAVSLLGLVVTLILGREDTE